jgi:hypothetical protein
VTSSLYRYGVIASIGGASSCVVTWETAAPPNGNATRLWEEAAFSVVRGYARTVEIHQQRLVFGGARSVGDAIWLSAIGQFFNFDLGTGLDGDAIAAKTPASRVRDIVHTVSGPQLTFFTDASVFYVPEQQSRAITPGNFAVKNVAPYGGADAKPGAFDGGLLFVQARGRAVRAERPGERQARQGWRRRLRVEPPGERRSGARPEGWAARGWSQEWLELLSVRERVGVERRLHKAGD